MIEKKKMIFWVEFFLNNSDCIFAKYFINAWTNVLKVISKLSVQTNVSIL